MEKDNNNLASGIPNINKNTVAEGLKQDRVALIDMAVEQFAEIIWQQIMFKEKMEDNED